MNLENTYKTLLQRASLVEGLPEPLKASDGHLQIFDNYIESTRIRLRKIRVPETKTWTRVLEQIDPFEEGKFGKVKISQMFLNEFENKIFERFKGREIRKNRYSYEVDGINFEIDVFLGKLWGLNTAKVYFETEEEQKNYVLPDFSIAEITDREFFTGNNLVDKDLADVQAEVAGYLK